MPLRRVYGGFEGLGDVREHTRVEPETINCLVSKCNCRHGGRLQHYYADPTAVQPSWVHDAYVKVACSCF